MPANAQVASFAFVESVLHIRTHQAQMRIRWRPTPQAEELVPGFSHWRPFWPDFRLLRPPQPPPGHSSDPLDYQIQRMPEEEASQKATAFATFRSEVPVEIVAAVEQFGNHQWPMMVMLREQPLALDLAVNNPVLAYALANSDAFRRTAPEAAAVQALWYCLRKQRAILAWLGFPGTEAMVRLLRRIPPASASPSILRRLRNVIASDHRVMELLAHLQVVNVAVLELVTNERLLDLVTPKLLMAVSSGSTEPQQFSVADMLLGSLALVREMDPKKVLTPFSSIQQIQRFREEVDAQYPVFLQRQKAAREEARRAAEQARSRRRREVNETPWQLRMREAESVRLHKQRQAELRRRPFPPPPIPGSNSTVPLTNAAQLEEEGNEQHNCVGSYANKVLAGDTYIYRILAPERATLSIIRCADGSWRRSELEAKNNKSARLATMQQVDDWLAQYCVSV